MSREVSGRHTERMTFALGGLAFGGGGSLVAERAIAKVPGVVHVYVNSVIEMAYVEYDAEQLDLSRLTAAVKRTGLQVAELQRR